MAQRLVTKVWNESAQSISFMWYQGKDAEPVPMIGPDGLPVVFNVGECPDEQKILYMLHGATQKASDGFSNAEVDSGGDIVVKRDLIVRTIVDAIASGMAGVWREKGEGIEREPALLYEGLVRAYSGKLPTVEAARAWIATLSLKAKKQMSAVPAVAAAIAAIKKERAIAKPPVVDEATAALAGL